MTPSTYAQNKPLVMELVETDEDLAAIAPAWNELLGKSARPEVMLAPDWVLTWWAHYRDGRAPAVGLFRDESGVVGLVPLCRRPFTYRPGIPFRRLEFMGANNEDIDGACGEYLAPIALAGREDEVAAAFAEALADNLFGAWDELVIELMDGEAPGTRSLVEALSAHYGDVSVTDAMEAYHLPLPADWETFLQGLHGKRRNWFRRSWKEFLAWAGTDGYRLERATTPEDVRRGMRILADLHGERWQEEGHDGAFASQRFAAFHEDYAVRLLEKGQLDLLWLLVGGVPVAAHYSFVFGNKVYFYQSGRTTKAPANVRLGIVMFMLAIEDAMKRGLSEYDFLGGDSGGYKTYFTSHTRQLVQLRVARPSLRETTRVALRSGYHRVRRLQSTARRLLGNGQ